MVWIHGGGYGWGSGQELLSYDGENLCHRGDVVVVTLNHRVNTFGFLNLSQLDERYRDSGNLGMIDLVFALEWIRDNIGNFGGDSGNVMIFGQSGGGGKVSTLMMMPSAKGLFHKAAVQSGSLLSSKSLEDSFTLTDAVLKELNISRVNMHSLHTISTEQLLACSIKAQSTFHQPPSHKVSLGIDFSVMSDVAMWAPIADGNIVSKQVWDPSLYSEIPLLVGSTLNEFVTGADKPAAFSMTESQLQDRVFYVYKEKAASILAAYRASHPGSNPFQLFSIIASQSVRSMAVKQAQQKAALQKAPAYLYWFAWQSPVLDGRAMAYHSLDLPFCFDNVDRCETSTGGGARAHALAARMSQAWINFARHGDPNHSELPKWDPITPDTAETMIFDDLCRLERDPDRAERELTT
jgi:para-nitrobenzyl esterase